MKESIQMCAQQGKIESRLHSAKKIIAQILPRMGEMRDKFGSLEDDCFLMQAWTRRRRDIHGDRVSGQGRFCFWFVSKSVYTNLKGGPLGCVIGNKR